MAVKIGHASIDERGRINGGAAGDSTGGEVCTRSWYNAGWNVVLRPKSSTLAEKSAKACEAACANNKIGYDQYQRNTLYTQAKAVNWDISKIKTACECDCSSLMHLCAMIGGANLTYGSNGLVTFNMVRAFVNSGDYEKLTASKYLTSDKHLKRGDILVKESGHTAMVLGNGASSTASTTTTTTTATSSTKPDPAKYFDRSLSKTYTVNVKTGSTLNMRLGAGTTKGIIKKLKRGEKVICYGYYSKNGSTVWLFVQDSDGTVGYCSKEYLK